MAEWRKNGERTNCTVWKADAGVVHGRRGICLLLDHGTVQADADADLAGRGDGILLFPSCQGTD